MGDEVGLKVYAGYKADERRIVFPHEDKLKATQKLKTILVGGYQEDDDKDILCQKERALITFPHDQCIEDDSKAQTFLNTPYVWKDANGRNVLAQTWTVNINKQFRDNFEIKETNEEPGHFKLAAAENFKKVMVDLFGEEARGVPLWYCKKQTTNRDRVYVGTTAEIKAFLAKQGVKEALEIDSVNGNEVQSQAIQAGRKMVVCTLPGKKTGVKKFMLSTNPEEIQMLYKRKGYTSFMCIKPKVNFEEDCMLFGLLG